MEISNSLHRAGGESSLPSPPPRTRIGFYAYLAPFVLVPLLIFAGALLIVPTRWFAMRSHSPYIPTVGYGSRLHNVNCPITIYGDSTAMVGVNPRLIQERTGLATCNISELIGMTMVFDTMVLDQFLANNPRPRMIVFLYAPENMDPQSQRNNPEMSKFEAIRYRFQQPNQLLGLMHVMRHPDDFFSWAERGARMSFSAIFAKPFPPSVRDARFKTLGQFKLGDSDLLSCSYPSRPVAPNASWIQSLRSRYNRDGTTVLVDVMPIPNCDPDIAYFRHALSGLIDNQLETLPVTDYDSGGGGGRHANARGSVPLSNMIADQILDRLHASPTIGAH